MGRGKVIIIIFGLCFLVLSLGFAQSTQDPFEQRISLDLRNIDIIEALKFLSSKTGMNIVTSKLVTGRVSLTVENCLVRDIFDIMLRSNGLAYDKRGDIYYIMTEQEYKTLYGKNFSDVREVKVFRLKYAIPSQAFSLLDTLKSDVGRILVDPESGNVLIMDIPENIIKMQKALEDFENKDLIEVFSLKYAKAKEVEEILKTKLDEKKVGSIKADERNNQVIVQALPERMEEVRRLISLLDRQTKEVLIDAKVIKVGLSDQVDSGIEWEGLFEVAKKYGLTYLGSYPFSYIAKSTDPWVPRYTWYKGGTLTVGNETYNYSGVNQVGSYPFSGTTSNYIATTTSSPAGTKKVLGEAMHVGIIDEKRDFDALLNYIKNIGNVQILSNPKLVVTNNQEARLHIGERQAYVTSTTTTGQTVSTVSEEVNFIDVGIQLAVTPTINDDGFITLKVKPEISSVITWLVTPTGNRIPIIDTTLTETTVLVKDGVSVLIGGLRKQEKTKTSQQTPILGKIPLLGFLFRAQKGSTVRSEYLVMLTPHIISGDVLVTGDERQDRGFRDYLSYVPQEKEILSQIKPKSYRDYQGE